MMNMQPQATPTTEAEASAARTTRIRMPYPGRVAMIVAAMFINIFVPPLILALPLQVIYDATGDSWPNWLLQVTTIMIKVMPTVGALGLVWLLMRFIDHRPVREAGLVVSKDSLPLTLVGIVCSILAVLPAGVLLTNAGLLRVETDYVDAGSPFWTFMMVMVMGLLMQGFPEELLWRGYGLQTMRHRPFAAFLVSGIVFGAMHYLSNAGQQNVAEHLIYLSSALGFGLLAGALAIVTKSLWAAVGVHFGTHVAYYLASLLAVGTGPWLWGTEAALYLIMTAIVFGRFRASFDVPISLAR